VGGRRRRTRRPPDSLSCLGGRRRRPSRTQERPTRARPLQPQPTPKSRRNYNSIRTPNSKQMTTERNEQNSRLTSSSWKVLEASPLSSPPLLCLATGGPRALPPIRPDTGRTERVYTRLKALFKFPLRDITAHPGGGCGERERVLISLRCR